MKPITILAIVCIMSLQTLFSQDTAKLRSREITKYLIEGIECKEILIERNKQLRSKDSTIEIQKNALDSVKSITKSIETDYKKLIEDNEVCNTQYNKLADKHYKTKKIVKGSIIINVILICLLIL